LFSTQVSKIIFLISSFFSNSLTQLKFFWLLVFLLNSSIWFSFLFQSTQCIYVLFTPLNMLFLAVYQHRLLPIRLFCSSPSIWFLAQILCIWSLGSLPLFLAYISDSLLRFSSAFQLAIEYSLKVVSWSSSIRVQLFRYYIL